MDFDPKDKRNMAITQGASPTASYPGEVAVEKPKVPDENVLWIEYDPMHEEFFSLIKQMCETFLAKNSDYAGSDAADMMKNFMSCQEFGIKMSDGIATRMSDKIMRMQNLMRTRKQMVKDESLLDTVMDLGCYCMLLAIALKREGPKLKVIIDDDGTDRSRIVCGEEK